MLREMCKTGEGMLIYKRGSFQGTWGYAGQRDLDYQKIVKSFFGMSGSGIAIYAQSLTPAVKTG